MIDFFNLAGVSFFSVLSIGSCVNITSVMKTISDKTAMAQWAKARYIRETHGITAPQLRRYADEGLIRSSNICRPGQTRGTRLFNVPDLEKLINESVERSSGVTSENGSAAAAGNLNDTSK